MSKQQTPAVVRIEKRPTQLRHVFLIDWNDSGIFKEVAVVKEDETDGTIYGILVDMLHPIDQSRLKKIVTSQHADKYPLWELMSQMTLKNGYNALDFFHANYVKVKRPRGAVVGGSLSDISTNLDDKMFDLGGFERADSSAGNTIL
jgi:hypothetical protein